MSDQQLLEKCERFPVTVDFSVGFDRMIAECGCSYDNPHINAENYPVIGSGVVQQEIFLVDLGAIDSSDAVRKLAEMGLEPAKIEHAFVFGKEYSDTQLDRSVVFLGSTGVKWCECPLYIDYWRGRRLLKLGDLYTQWAQGCYFAAIRREESQETFPITIDYNRTLKQMIATCGCTYNNPNITAENFPISDTGIVQQEILLFDFRRSIDSDEAQAILAVMGLEPARVEHALAFGEKYPEAQRERPIVFLGSFWEGRAPCLARLCNERALDLGDREAGWTRHCRFAVVRKVSDSVS